MRAGFFSDLDNTLLFSERSGYPALTADITQVETHTDGSGGYLSNTTLARLGRLSKQIPFVPTTTRSEQQYRGIAFPGVQIEYAIVANGATLLRCGVREEEWAAHMLTNVLPASAPLRDVRASVKWILDAAEVERRDKTVEELFLYAYMLDPRQLTGNVMLSLETLAADVNWKISLQKRKLYFLPAGLTKGAAAKAVAVRLGVDKLLAAGDSRLDISLLDVADHAWGLEGELDSLNPYPYSRVPQAGFAGADALLTLVSAQAELA